MTRIALSSVGHGRNNGKESGRGRPRARLGQLIERQSKARLYESVPAVDHHLAHLSQY